MKALDTFKEVATNVNNKYISDFKKNFWTEFAIPSVMFITQSETLRNQL